MSGRVFARAGIVLALLLGSETAQAAAPVEVTIFAINDLHGNLLPPADGVALPDPDSHAGKVVAAGGVAQMATMLRRLRAHNPNTIFVGAGDLIGASPLLSAMFDDEPTVEALSQMGLEVSAVGNHEFDKGKDEQLRIQNGGCGRDHGCHGGHVFKGAKYHYLAASTIVTATGKTLLPPYYIKHFHGIPVAFIGLALKGTPAIVSSGATAGLEFRDEAQTVNALVPELRARGIEAIVVLIHQGGTPHQGYNGCGVEDVIPQIVRQFDKAVDVVISGHTHRAYNCIIDGRLVTSAHRYGTMLTRIDLTLDSKSHDVIAAKADNLVVRSSRYPADPALAKLVAQYAALAAPVADKVVGNVTAPVTTNQNRTGETALGDMIADAMLADAKGARIALLNSGGIRSDIATAGEVTHADLFAVQPFGNKLMTLDLTGAQIKALLEQQWSGDGPAHILQISAGFSYRWNPARPKGDRVAADSLMLDGVPIRAETVYRVATPDFLAAGGEGMTVLRDGTNKLTGAVLLDMVETWLAAHSPYTPAIAGRIQIEP